MRQKQEQENSVRGAGNIEHISGMKNTCTDLLWTKLDTNDSPDENEFSEPDINDNTFEEGTKNSNQFNLKDFAICNMPAKGSVEVQHSNFKELDMPLEQGKDKNIIELKTQLEQGEPSMAMATWASKRHDSNRKKYFWPNLFQEFYE